MIRVERESVQLIAVVVERDGAPIVPAEYPSLQLADVADGERPNGWDAPAVLPDGSYGVLTGGKPSGVRRIFYRLDAAPETPVVDVGTYRVV